MRLFSGCAGTPQILPSRYLPRAVIKPVPEVVEASLGQVLHGTEGGHTGV